MDDSKIEINEEIIWLVFYIIILMVLGYWLKDFFSLSWEKGLLQNDFKLSLGNISIIISIFAGIYYGILIVTFFKNPFKKVQATILLIFSVIVTISYMKSNIINNRVYENISFFFVSLLISSQYTRKQNVPTCNFGVITFDKIIKAKGKERSKLIIDKLKEPLTLVLCLTSFIIISSMFNYLAGYYYKNQVFPDGTMIYILFTGIFIYMYYLFMNYEINQENVFVLGPPRVGKTVFMGALCLKAHGLPNDILNNRIHVMKYKWPAPNNEVDEVVFTFNNGKFFTKCNKISTIDYPGSMILIGINETFQALQMLKVIHRPSSFSDLIDRIDLENVIPNSYKSQERKDIKKIILHIKDSKKIIYLISATSLREDADMSLYSTDISKFENYIKIYELITDVTDIPFMIVFNKIDKEYAANLNKNTDVTLDDVAKWIIKDLDKTWNTNFIKHQRAIVRLDSQTNDGISCIFPSWVNGDENKPSFKNGSIDGVGYEAIIKQL